MNGGGGDKLRRCCFVKDMTFREPARRTMRRVGDRLRGGSCKSWGVQELAERETAILVSACVRVRLLEH